VKRPKASPLTERNHGCGNPAEHPGTASHSGTSRDSRDLLSPRGLMQKVVWRPLGALTPFPGNPRRHPEDQIARLMRSIERVWTNPILIDETGTILAGHARLEAAKRLGRSEVPTLTIAGLSAAEKRAVVVADNRLPEQAVWDFDLLREHFKELIDLDFDVELTGFSTGEIDLVLDGKPAPAATDPADDLTGLDDGLAVSRPGEVWELGRHRLVCGDALNDTSYQALLQGELAQMMVTDPPYNVPIKGHAVGRGKTRHREFTMAAGEMSGRPTPPFSQASSATPSPSASTDRSNFCSSTGGISPSCRGPLGRSKPSGRTSWSGTKPMPGRARSIARSTS